MRIIHTADWHLNEKQKDQQKAEHSLQQLVSYCQDNLVDGLIIAGDIWDKIQQYGNGSGVSLAYKYLYLLAKKVGFIFIIKGNNAHDNPQSVNLLHQLTNNIFAYEYNVALAINFGGADDYTIKAIDKLRSNDTMHPDLIIHGLPYPTKQSVLQTDSIDNQNANFIELYRQILALHGNISKQYPDTPKVSVFHGNVSGARLSNGQTLIGQDIIIPDFVLQETKANYYALGHIHLPQQVAPDMFYSGSLYNKDFGETEQKYFNVIEFEGTKYTLTQVAFEQAKPMIVVNARFENGQFLIKEEIPQNAEIKIKYEVLENERCLITKEMLDNLAKELGGDVKFDAKIIPTERTSRSENIMKAKTLEEEVVEYASVVNREITESILEKVRGLQ